MKKISKESSMILNAMRAFAIFSVICAHTNYVESNSYGMILSSSILALVGTGGVSLFFILAGFFLAYNHDSIFTFCKKKMIRLVIPWIVTGTIVYLFSNIRKNNVSFLGLVKNLLGSGSYLWFLSVLFVLYFIFYFLGKCSFFNIIAPILSIASFFINDLIYPYIWSWGGDYLNFVNWMFFFWLGYISAKKGLLDKLLNYTVRKQSICFLYLISYVICFCLFICLGIKINYRTPLYILYAVLFFYVCMSLAVIVRNSKLFAMIGKDSFTIYLIHMPFAGIFVYVGNSYFPYWQFELCRPFIVLFLVETAIVIFRIIVNRLPEKPSKILKICIGLR